MFDAGLNLWECLYWSCISIISFVCNMRYSTKPCQLGISSFFLLFHDSISKLKQQKKSSSWGVITLLGCLNVLKVLCGVVVAFTYDDTTPMVVCIALGFVKKAHN